MRKFIIRLGRTRCMILLYILLIVANYCYNGWRGAIAAVFGCIIGTLIYDWKIWKPRLINFFRHNTEFKVKTIIFIPIISWCIWYDGLRGLIVGIIGWCIGEFLSRRYLKQFLKRHLR